MGVFLEHLHGGASGTSFRVSAALAGSPPERLSAKLHLDQEAASVGGSRDLKEAVAREGLQRILENDLQCGLGIGRGNRGHERVEMLCEEFRDVGEPSVEQQCAHDRLEGGGKDGRPPPAARVLSASQSEERWESQLRRRLGQRGAVYHTGTEPGQLSGREVGMPPIEVQRHEEREDRVAEKLEALEGASLASDRGMGERRLE